MRPVDRGQPQQPDTPVTYYSNPDNYPGVIVSMETLVDAKNQIINIETKQARIKAENNFPSLWQPMDLGDGNMENYDMMDLVTEEARLQMAYNQSFGEDKEEVAQELLNNLQAQLTYYEAEIATYKEYIEDTYTDARKDLIRNLGQYCSYCGIPVPSDAHVEHMLPKSYFPDLAAEWTNFLLACGMCNSYKNDKPTPVPAQQHYGNNPAPTWRQIEDYTRTLYVWPDDSVKGYTDFTQAFRFDLKGVQYNRFGHLINIFDIGDEFLYGDAGHTQIKLNAFNNYAVSIEAYRPLNKPAPFKTVQAFIQNQIEALQNMNAIYGIDTNAENISDIQTVILNQQWRVTATRGYTVTSTGFDRRITVTRNTGTNQPQILMNQTFPDEQYGSYQLNLTSGQVPPPVLDVLIPDGLQLLLQPQVEKLSLTDFTITTVKTYLFELKNNLMHTIWQQIMNVELHLEPVQWNYTPAATSVRDALSLNHIDPSNAKFSDRRMLNRTKAWCIAKVSLQRLLQVRNSLLNDAQYLQNMQDALLYTAQGTGFWSVWYWVFTQPDAAHLPEGLASFLITPGNYPGTRQGNW